MIYVDASITFTGWSALTGVIQAESPITVNTGVTVGAFGWLSVNPGAITLNGTGAITNIAAIFAGAIPSTGTNRVGIAVRGANSLTAVSIGGWDGTNIDADTGLDWPAANAMRLIAGGTEFIRTNATGIGVFAVAPVARQTSAANLTNNVAVGGVDDTIANYTDLVTYSVDAGAIRNDLYQLSRKVKQVNDALRLYGWLT